MCVLVNFTKQMSRYLLRLLYPYNTTMTECFFTYCTGQLSCGLHCDSQLNNPILMIMWLLNQRFLVV